MDQHIDTYIEFFLTSRQAAGRNGNVFALQEAMGHEDIATTRLYVHPDFKEIKAWHTEASPANDLDVDL
jgi:site-specific recombinase XerC